MGFLFFFLLCLSSAGTIKYLSLIMTALVVVAVIVKHKTLRARFAAPLLALSLFVLMDGLSMSYAVSGKFTMYEFLKIFVSYTMALLFIAVAPGQDRSDEPGRWIATIWSVVTALAGLVSIDLLSTHILSGPVLSFLGLFSADYENLIFLETGIRLNGLFTNPNAFAGTIGIGVLLSLGLAVNTAPSWQRQAHLVCLYLSSLAFLLAFSMGASGTLALGFLVFVFLEKPEKRFSLLLLMVETFVLAIAAAALVSMTAFTAWDGLEPVPLLCAIVGCVLLCCLQTLVADKFSHKLEISNKLLGIIVAVVVALAAVFALVAWNFTGSIQITPGNPIRRAAYPDPGHYELGMEHEGAVTVSIESQNSQETIMHTSTVLYNGDVDSASFDVPEGSLVVYFNFSSGETATLLSAQYTGAAGSGKIPLGYKLLPSFIANRLQGLLANENAIQRTEFFSDGMKLFRRSPLLGLGMGAFESAIKGVQSFYYETKYAHNHYIQLLVETGIIGLALFVGLFAVCFVTVWRARKTYFMAPALGALLVFMAAHASVEVVFSFYSYLPLAFAVFAIVNLCGVTQTDFWAIPKKIGSACVAAVTALVLVFAGLMGGNLMAAKLNEEEVSLTSLTQAIALDKFEWADYMLAYVTSMTYLDPTADMLEQADIYAERLSRVNSNTIPIYLAEYYFNTGRTELAMSMIEKYCSYVASDPNTWSMAFSLLEGYEQDTPEYRAHVLAIADMLDTWNAENIGNVSMTDSARAFVDRIRAMS